MSHLVGSFTAFRAGPNNRDANAFLRRGSANAIKRVIMLNVTANRATMDRRGTFPRCNVVIIVIISSGRARRVANLFRNDRRTHVRFQDTDLFRTNACRCNILIKDNFIVFQRESIRRYRYERELTAILYFVDNALPAMPIRLIRDRPIMPLCIK